MIPAAESGVPGIAVIVPSAALPRYISFELSLEGLWLPDKSSLGRIHGPALAKNLNQGIKNADADAKFFWFIDDDHKFDPQIAIRLATHNVPIVVALTCMARPPFTPTLYKSAVQKDGHIYHQPYTWPELDGKGGLFPVFACGRAGIMVRRDVLDALGEPWFRMGQVNPDEANEDFDFCERVRVLGIPILADLDTVHGHTSPCTAWPTLDAQGRWCVKFEWENGQGFQMYRAEPPG